MNRYPIKVRTLISLISDHGTVKGGPSDHGTGKGGPSDHGTIKGGPSNHGTIKGQPFGSLVRSLVSVEYLFHKE